MPTYAFSVVIGSDSFGEFSEAIKGMHTCMAVPGAEGMCRSQAALWPIGLVYAYIISLRLTDSKCVLLYLRAFESKSQGH